MRADIACTAYISSQGSHITVAPESQGIWVVRESQGIWVVLPEKVREFSGWSEKVRKFGWSEESQEILDGVREKKEKKKKRVINKRTCDTIYNIICR